MLLALRLQPLIARELSDTGSLVSKEPHLMTRALPYRPYSAYLSQLPESRRADSNRLPLLITSDNSGVAEVCMGLQTPISKPVSFLCLALRCTVLRSRWCQSGVTLSCS